MEPLLEGKVAVIYGAGGIAGGVARVFAREGARVFLASRSRDRLDAVAAGVSEAGGSAEVAVVDALDEAAVSDHATSVVEAAGSIDVSINLISRGDVQGQPLLDLSIDDLMAPVVNGLRTNAITARTAARQMVGQGSGSILWLTSASSVGLAPMMGGTGPSDAAIETYMRYLAAEVGPSGVRVNGIWTAGVVETLTQANVEEVGGAGMPPVEEIIDMLAQASMLKRAVRLDQVTEAAAFLASDRASGITASITNVTCGIVAAR